MRVLALVLLGLALRLLHLARLGDLEFDEIVSVRYAALSPGELLPRLAGALFEHPPAYYLALGWWRALFGEDDLVARLFSVFLGTLMVPLTYAAGTRLYGRRAGAIAALLLAVAPLPLFYSREARMYALVACLVLATFWLFARAMARRRGPGTWAVYAVTAVLAALVHYAGVLAILGQLACAGVFRGEIGRRVRPALFSMGIVAVAALSWAATAQGMRGSFAALDTGHLATAPVALWQTWLELAAGPERAGLTGAIAGVALLALAAAGLPRLRPTRLLMLAAFATGVLAVVVAVAIGKPVQGRYLLPAAPFVYLCAGAAVHRLLTVWANRRWQPVRSLPPLSAGARLERVKYGVTAYGGGIAAAAVVLAGMAPFWASYYGNYRRADYSDATSQIATFERPGDAILLTGPWQAWYFDYFYPKQGGTILHRVLPKDAPPALDPAQARVELEEIAADRRRLWFVQAGLAQADPTNFVEGWLQHHAWPAIRLPHQNAVLSLYALQPPDVQRPLKAQDFGGAIRLNAGWVDGEEVPATDVARLWLEFEALRPLTTDYKVSLRLVGADGQRFSTDFDIVDLAAGSSPTSAWRPGQRAGMRRGLWVPPTANPQPYEVRLVVYDARTLEPLPPLDEYGRPLGSPGGEAAVGGMYATQSRAGKSQSAAGTIPVGRTFGGGDDFDAIHLKGLRWHQPVPSPGPLVADLLWRLDGVSGTMHHSHLAVVDAQGRAWLEERRPLFAGTFNIHDWREGEVLGERRSLDVSSLPDGRYTIQARLYDARGRALPVDGTVADSGASAIELHRFTLPYRRPLVERLRGFVDRITSRR